MREIYARHARHDAAGVYELYDPEIVWDVTGHANLSGMGFGVYHGHAGVRRFWREWLTAWELSDLQLDELIPVGDDVVAFGLQRTRGQASGARVGMAYADVWTLRDGLVVRYRLFDEPAKALAAAGVPASSDVGHPAAGT